jgi:hypothetical protein
MLLLMVYFINDTIWFYKWYEKIKVYILKSCLILSKLKHDFPHVNFYKESSKSSVSIIIMKNELPLKTDISLIKFNSAGKVDVRSSLTWV